MLNKTLNYEPNSARTKPGLALGKENKIMTALRVM
jgi:hypothetical protein